MDICSSNKGKCYTYLKKKERERERKKEGRLILGLWFDLFFYGTLFLVVKSV